MNVLVTGAAGFIGSHLGEALASLGHRVTGLDCFSDYYCPALKRANAAALAARGVPILELDLAEDDLSAAVGDAQVVYHLAAQPGISARVPLQAYVRQNITATHRLLEALEGGGGGAYLVNVSTSSVYGARATNAEDAVPEPISPYGVTKLAAEQLALASCRSGRLWVCSVRLFSVYGERERPEKLFPKLIRSILDDTEFPLYEGSLEHRRAFTYVGDAVAGLAAVPENLEACRGQIVNLGSDREESTARGIEIVQELLGRRARLRPEPGRAGDQERTCAEIAKARALLGYEPKTALEEGLVAEVRWFVEHHC